VAICLNAAAILRLEGITDLKSYDAGADSLRFLRSASGGNTTLEVWSRETAAFWGC